MTAPTRWRWAAALAAGLLLPALILFPAAFGPRTYLPRDPATLDPAAWQYDAGQLETALEGTNYDCPEVSAWFVPELRAARRALEDGAWPGWSPWTHGGSVLQGHGHTALLYPPTWIALAHPDPQDGLVWIAWTHLAAAFVLAFGFLRHLGLVHGAAALGGLAFALSGTLCANAPFYPRLGSIVWLPGLLWAARALADRHARGAGTGGAACAMAATMALTWLAGFPPNTAAATLVAAAWCLHLVWTAPARRVGLALRLLGAAALGLGVAAPHLWPVLAFFPESNRAIAPALTQVSHNVFPIGGTLGYLLPEVFGHMADATLPADRSPLAYLLLPRTEWSTDRPLLPGFVATEYAVFAGTAALALAPLGALRWRGAGPTGRFPLLAFVALLALAGGWPLARELYRLPLLPTVAPMRFTGPAALAVAWLAALGLDRIARGAVGPRGLWTSAALVGAAAACGSWLWLGWDPTTLPTEQGWARSIVEDYQAATPELELTEEVVRTLFVREDGEDLMVTGARRLVTGLGVAAIGLWALALWLAALARWGRREAVRRAAVWVVLAATAWQLGRHGHLANQGVLALPSARSPVHERLARERDERAEAGGLGVIRAGRVPDVPLFVPPGSLGGDGVRDFQVYSFIDGRSNRPFVELQARHALAAQGLPWARADAAQRAEARELAEATIYGGAVPATLPDAPEVLGSPYLDLVGIHRILARRPLRHAGEAEAIEIGGRTAYVHANPGALPRAFVVADLRSVADEERVVDALLDPAFDPRERAIVTDEVARSMRQPLPPSRPGLFDERPVRFVRDRAGAVELDIGGTGGGYLILADTFLEGWSAHVDGAPAALRRANLWMRMLPLPENPCTVALVYTTPGLWPGCIVALAAALLLVGWWLPWPSRRHSRPSDNTV